jgi:predicted acyl esterase
MTHDPAPPAPATAGWQRPTVPPEGEKDFLDEHPFDLQRSALPDSVLVEQVTIPMRDGITLAGTLFRPVARFMSRQCSSGHRGPTGR